MVRALDNVDAMLTLSGAL